MLLLLLLLLLPLFLLFGKKKRAKGETLHIPPSPPKLPILGNLHQLGELLHQSYFELSKKYGPVMLLHLGHLPTVVISSAEAAKEALKDHDLACCSRPLLAGSGRLSYNHLDIAFAPYGERWRKMRQLVVLELFSLKRVHSFRPLREAEVGLLINSISESASSATSIINLTDMLFALTANITFKMSFGFDYRGTDFDRDRFHEVVHEAEAVGGRLSTGELFPFGGWIIDRINGHHARTERVFYELDKFFQHVIDDHLKPGRQKEHDDMIDVLLQIEKEQTQLEGERAHFTTNNIKGVLQNLFVAGVDTTAITLNWAMTELMKNPRVMKKLQEEVRTCIGNQGKVTEVDIGKLEYLKMVVKETFRLHPAAPLLLPRETRSHIKVNGFDIYPKTMIQVNVWAIGRDPNYWEDPSEFIPERYADSSIDFKGKDFEFLPFGAGRRMCIAVSLGTITIELILANLVYCFDWKLPDGMQKEDINMEEQTGASLTVSKKTPLCLVPVKYLH